MKKTQKLNNQCQTIIKKPDFSSKLTKLNSLLENSISFQTKLTKMNAPSSAFSLGDKPEELTKDLPLYLSLTEKPINLLFSLDQFVFEFSKKTYQQRKTGEFFQQLKERKKLSLFYGDLTRKQIATLFQKAAKLKGYFSKNLFSLIERRLDVVLYRSGLTQTIAEARQLIKHNKVRVNDARVTVSSYSVNSGDIVTIKSETQSILIRQLVSALNTDKVKKHSKVFEEYYLRLKKLVDGSPFQGKKVSLKKNFPKKSHPQSTNNLKHHQYSSNEQIYSKVICNSLIECVSSRIKSRCFFFLFSEFLPNQQKTETLFTNSQDLKKKKILTVLKWKLSPWLKPSQKKALHQRKITKGLSHSEKILYVTGGCLEKKPLFWNQTILSANKRKSFFLKTSQVLKDFNSLKNKKRLVLKTSFLLFLKHLSTSKKFQSLIVLNFKKALSKKSIDQARFSFSQILHWRTSKPIHLETSYNLLTTIFLYAPQRINFPFSLDLDLIHRSLR